MKKKHGLYIHIPFCSKACSYCDFHFSTNLRYMRQMCSAIRKEMEMRREEWADKELVSIYFGGGTPGLLPENELKEFFLLFEGLRLLDDVREITLEANPENISKENITLWNSLGINRVSLGIQSLYDSELEWMRRSHNSEQSIRALNLLQDYFKGTLTADIIFGTPFLNLEMLASELDILTAYPLQHLSAYQLTVEPKTLLQKEIQNQKIKISDEDTIAEQFLFIHDFLESKGYEHYEISNYAKPGYRAIHNSLYWQGESYSGFGPSAHSYDGIITRTKNIANNHEYMRLVVQEGKPAETELLDERQRFNDFVLTHIRTTDGIDLNEVEKKFTSDKKNHILKTIKDFPSDWFIIEESAVSLSVKGMLFSDFISEKIFL
ncbi:MAG: radical SAM family heme chaperone HemW [Bacteroidia bacterium]|nr:radical SAM family heme chaperone HemW [Bacteroidia bacterium]